MSRINVLIEELCPDGVPFLPLGECVLANLGGGTPSRSRSEYWNGDIPWASVGDITATKLSISKTRQAITSVGLESSSSNLVPAGWVVVAVKIAPGAMRVTEREVAINQDLRGLRLTEAVDPYFLTYYFKTLKVVGNGTIVKGITNQTLLRLRIPVPPLEVQREIVRILDQFTQLEAELEAELEARKRQRDYYRHDLLSPSDGWQTVKLGDVAEVFDGPHATPKKTATGPWYLSISSLKNGRFDLNSSAHLGIEDLAKWTRRVEPRPGDTMFSYETRIGQAAFWDRDEPAALGRRMGLLRPAPGAVDPEFLTLAYLGPQFQEVIRSKTVSGSTVDRIPIANMTEWPIALPAFEEQRRIVEALRAFDTLTNDLRSGLPAELAARRKQYEYYRDRLLTFEEATA